MYVGFEFCSRKGFRAVVSQAKIHDSHVRLKTDSDIYILIIHFISHAHFILDLFDHSMYNFIS